ncbi:PEP-CTERM sorting domain-containing protein [Cerasicoccus fimbriatus]|uniref:PEP-CTERM sorting domain-containing protein n=1 Tax=Cerasicoccus fimbriatus TaxID=3014554 RepID=UPI0022B51826|nr:PEP-CTERM sorting domain-containing protein [Cerasicoccus sp. TK19100]
MPALSNAALVVQSENFDTTLFNGTPGSSPFVQNVNNVSAVFNPFDSGLGTLNSFTIAWSYTLTTNATTGASGGSIGASLSGSYSVDTFGYNGNGGGFGGGNGPNSPVSASTGNLAQSITFLPADAGVSYDPAILATITGGSPFTLTWGDLGTGFLGTFSLSGISTALVTIDPGSSVTLTYDYSPSAIPEPSTYLAIAGFTMIGAVLYIRRRKQHAKAD